MLFALLISTLTSCKIIIQIIIQADKTTESQFLPKFFKFMDTDPSKNKTMKP